MRNYIRHPIDIPIHVTHGVQNREQVKVRNLSVGGLSFITHVLLKVGTVVDLLIPVVKPDYKGAGVIVWRREQSPTEFEVGVRFASDDEYFRVRMMEQVCQIDAYRQRMLIEEGRELSTEQAALEWIGKYAATFDAEHSSDNNTLRAAPAEAKNMTDEQ